MIYDISRPISPETSRWPGDEPFSLSRSASIAGGAECNVGVLHTSVHFGTHVDAPYHFIEDRETVDDLRLDIYWGAAAVVDARDRGVITIDLFDEVDLTVVPRLLIKTDIWRDHSVFPTDYPVIEPGVPEYLARFGVKLLGLDLPSVDSFGSTGMTNHHALAAHRIFILESLDLTAVAAGLYELTALPLKIVGGDGSPVRAALRDLPVTAQEDSRRLGQ